MKKYDEFDGKEKKAIINLNDIYFVASLAPDMKDTRAEQTEALRKFNKKFGYDFTAFYMNPQDVKKTWFA